MGVTKFRDTAYCPKGRKKSIRVRALDFESPLPHRGRCSGVRKSTINLPGLSVDSIRNERHKFIKRTYLIWRDDLRESKREQKPTEGEPTTGSESQTT